MGNLITQPISILDINGIYSIISSFFLNLWVYKKVTKKIYEESRK